MTNRAGFVILMCLAGACAGAMMLPELAMRPMHTDEAVHAWKLGDLIERNYYRYDPNEYHGPTLNYFTLPVAVLRGQGSYARLDEVTLRLVPAICGIAMVLAAMLLLDGLGRWAAAAAALLTAVSPAMTYYSRYYIMEVPLVLFTFLLIAMGYRYARSGRALWALLAGAAAGLMYATKETWVFAIAAMLAALSASACWRKLRPGGETQPAVAVKARVWNWRVVAALAIFVAVAGLFFSSFGTNKDGPLDAVAAYGHAASRAFGGSAEGGSLHTHPWNFYLEKLFWTDYPFRGTEWNVPFTERLSTAVVHRPGPGPVWTEVFIGLLAICGMAAGFARRGIGAADVRLVRFLSVYTLVLLAIYTVLPYKTPWCVLSPLHGMILLAGVGVAAVVRWMRWLPLRIVMCVFLSAGAAHLGYLAYLTNFKHYDNRRNPWVYAHTLNGAVRLGQRVEEVASVHPDHLAMRINVITPDKFCLWPVPWYLRRFDQKRIAYCLQVPADANAPVIIYSPEAAELLQQSLGDRYVYDYYGLRPGGVVLTLAVQQDLWAKFREEVLVPAAKKMAEQRKKAAEMRKAGSPP